ncbi:MAG TPA: hypothetical protein VGM27_15255, partial [Acidobacteriaceae bacterium]
LIAAEHVLTRSCANFESLSPNHLRASIRRKAENTRLVEALRRVIDRQKVKRPGDCGNGFWGYTDTAHGV